MFLIVVPLRRVIIMGILICRASVLQMVMQVALQDIGQLTDIRAAASGKRSALDEWHAEPRRLKSVSNEAVTARLRLA
jgi:hypothetical protein